MWLKLQAISCLAIDEWYLSLKLNRAYWLMGVSLFDVALPDMICNENNTISLLIITLEGLT